MSWVKGVAGGRGELQTMLLHASVPKDSDLQPDPTGEERWTNQRFAEQYKANTQLG